MKRTRIIQGVAGFLLAGAGLFIFFRKSGSGEDGIFAMLAREISHISAATVVACAVLTLLGLWLRAVRLAIMLPDSVSPGMPVTKDGPAADNEASPSSLSSPQPTTPPVISQNKSATPHKRGMFAIIMVSFMLNNILPARLGEAARAVLVWKRNKYPFAVSIGSLLVERVLDIIAYLSFLVIPVFVLPEISAGLRGINPAAMPFIWLSAACLIALIFVSALYAAAPRVFRGAAGRLCAFFSRGGRRRGKIIAKAQKLGAEAESSLEWAFSPRKAAAVTALSFAIASCYAAMLALLVADLSVSGVLKSFFGQAFAAFGTAIPLAPGYVGTLHAVLQAGLVITGLEPGKAGAVVVIYHALQYVVVTVVGLAFLAGMNIKLKDITA